MHKRSDMLWLLAALAAPLAHFSGAGWYVTGLAVLAALPFVLLTGRWEGLGKPLILAQILWLGAAAGVLLQSSAAYWPSDNDLAVPLTILLLAALTREEAIPRVGAVLAFCMALLAIPAAISGATHLHPQWLGPAAAPWPWGLWLTLLIPRLPAAEGADRGRSAAYTGALALVLSALVQGTISAPVAASVPDPFYQTARTLGYLEPVIAVGITLGWFALSGYLLSSARRICAGSGIKEQWACVLAAGTSAAVILLRVQPEQPIMGLLSALFWVLIPFLNKIKKVEKSEN